MGLFFPEAGRARPHAAARLRLVPELGVRPELFSVAASSVLGYRIAEFLPAGRHCLDDFDDFVVFCMGGRPVCFLWLAFCLGSFADGSPPILEQPSHPKACLALLEVGAQAYARKKTMSGGILWVSRNCIRIGLRD